MSQIEKLDAEIKEMEDKLFNETTPASEDNLEGTQDVDLTKPVRNNWKKKYTDLRSHHDGLAFQLRSELADAKQARLDMQEQVTQLRDQVVAVPDETHSLSQEEEDILGKDAISAIDKMNRQGLRLGTVLSRVTVQKSP